MAARVSSAGRVAYSLRTAVLWLTYFVIGLTNYVKRTNRDWGF